MHVDHVIFASGPQSIKADIMHLTGRLGADFEEGGFYPQLRTRNYIIPPADSRCLGVVGVLDHPAAAETSFGQAVRARFEMGGGQLDWAVSVDDITPFEERLEHSAVPGSHQFPDGRYLEWRQLGTKGLVADPQLPFFLQWVSNKQLRPSFLTSDLHLNGIQISDSASRPPEWLGIPANDSLGGIHLNLIVPNRHPRITQVTFKSPMKGVVVI